MDESTSPPKCGRVILATYVIGILIYLVFAPPGFRIFKAILMFPFLAFHGVVISYPWFNISIVLVWALLLIWGKVQEYYGALGIGCSVLAVHWLFCIVWAITHVQDWF